MSNGARKSAGLLAGLGAMIGLLAGCGGDSGDPSAPVDAASPTQDASPDDDALPQSDAGEGSTADGDDTDAEADGPQLRDYMLRVHYDGPLPLGPVEVLLFDTDRTCDTLVPDPSAPPSSDVPYVAISIYPDAVGTIPDRPVSFPANVTLRYAVAWAPAVTDTQEITPYHATFGCQDGIEASGGSDPSLVEVTMANLFPSTAGAFTLQAEVHPTMPTGYDALANGMVREMLATPGLGLLRCSALAAQGVDYASVAPWDVLFDTCTAPGQPSAACQSGGEVVPSTMGNVVADAYAQAFEQAVTGLPGWQGGTAAGALSSGQEVFDNVQRVGLGGTLFVQSDPDSAGVLASDTSVLFNSVTWHWGGTERVLGLDSNDLIDADGLSTAVVFHPDVQGAYALEFSPFVLDLDYARLGVQVLEHVVLPTYLAPEVDGLASVYQLLDCQDLGARLTCSPPYDVPGCADTGSSVANAVRMHCEAMQLSPGTCVDVWLDSHPASKSTLRLSSPPSAPCLTRVPPDSDAFRVHGLGGPPPEPWCDWQGRIESAGSSQPEPCSVSFWAERL